MPWVCVRPGRRQHFRMDGARKQGKRLGSLAVLCALPFFKDLMQDERGKIAVSGLVSQCVTMSNGRVCRIHIVILRVSPTWPQASRFYRHSAILLLWLHARLWLCRYDVDTHMISYGLVSVCMCCTVESRSSVFYRYPETPSCAVMFASRSAPGSAVPRPRPGVTRTHRQ